MTAGGLSPGPAGYSVVAATAFERTARQGGIPSSAFKSQIERFKDRRGPTAPDSTPLGVADERAIRGDPRALGPGSYNLSRVWNNRRRFSTGAAFLSSDARFVPSETEERVSQPGPGTYRIPSCLQSINNEKRRPCFTIERRFPDRTPSFPGPGAYECGRDVVRKSFNITFD